MDGSAIDLSEPVELALEYLEYGLGYECGQVLGKGTYGSVVQVMRKESYFAAKIVEQRMVNDMEIRTWPKLGHQNILKLLETDTQLDGVVIFFTELMATNLFLRLQDHSFKDDPTALERCRTYAKQVFSGMAYLHRRQLCHLDLRAENIFLSAIEDRAVVADFSGLSWAYMDKKFCPLPHSLRPPEMLTSKRHVPPLPIDLWSCGLLLANMYMGKGFYVCTVKHKNAGHIQAVRQYTALFQSDAYVKKFIHETYPFAKHSRKSSKNLISIIHGFLKMNPKQRLHIEQALYHPFLVSDLMDSMEVEVQDIEKLSSAATLQQCIDESNLKRAGNSEEFQVTISKSKSKVVVNLNKTPDHEDGKRSRWSRYKMRFTQLRKFPMKSVPLLRLIHLRNEKRAKKRVKAKADPTVTEV